MIKVEYLFPFNTKNGICKDLESFNSLLSAHSDISIINETITYRGSEYGYKVSLDEVPNQDYSVYHVTFEFTRNTAKFRNMLKAVKQVVGVHIKDNIQIIWDGVGFEWSQDLYPRIYQVENYLRKLISKFMLVNLGIGWHVKTVPKDVVETIKNPVAKENHSILYSVDFIQLSHFLFKSYALKDTNFLPEVMGEMLDRELTQSDKEEIQKYIPKNNWDRYFSEILNMESEQLESKWRKLYEIRNKIAHNNSLKMQDFESGKELCDFLIPILGDAINSLEQIEVPLEQRESVSLNSMASMNEDVRPFVEDYQNFSNGIVDTFRNNTELFATITDATQPIQSLIDNFQSPFENNELTTALSSIEDSKHKLINGFGDARLADFSSVNELFINASSRLTESFKDVNIEWPDSITSYIPKVHSFHEENEEEE